MRVLVQRVSEALVCIEGKKVSQIEKGFLVLLGIEELDGEEDVQWLSQKILGLRVFSDEEGKMNRSLLEVGGEILLVSQFTLFASTKKGNRPSFIRAAKPDRAVPLYERMISVLEGGLGKSIQTGVFGGDMKVSLINEGPVTIWMDSKLKE